MSSDEFGDSDDEIFALVDQVSSKKIQIESDTGIEGASVIDGLTEQEKELLSAKGEISILRNQLDLVENRNKNELRGLKESNETLKKTYTSQLNQLRSSLQQLEDERKFLNNELKISKKRRIDTNIRGNITPSPNGSSGSIVTVATTMSNPIITTGGSLPTPPIIAPIVAQKVVVKMSPETYQFADYLMKIRIPGFKRTSLEYLSSITIPFDHEGNHFQIGSKKPISENIVKYLNNFKEYLRLDELLAQFLDNLVHFINVLIDKNHILSIPFLLSIIDNSLNFRPAALNDDLLIRLYHFCLDLNIKYNDNLNNNYPQYQLLQNMINLFKFELIETLVKLNSKLFDSNELFSLIKRNLSSSSASINLIYCNLEILKIIVHDSKIDMKEFLINLVNLSFQRIQYVENYQFYGLIRVIGCNGDHKKVDSIVPSLSNKLLIIPYPLEDQKSKESTLYNEEFEILLTNNIIELIEIHSYYNEESYIEIINPLIIMVTKQQEYLIRSPRSRYVHLRINLISKIIYNLYNLLNNYDDLMNKLSFDTLLELSIILTRISFSKTNLYFEAMKMVKKLGSSKIFNKWSDLKNSNLNHVLIDTNNDINIEINNGLEFQYSNSTIEISRKILEIITTLEESDNLYLNMNVANTDDMDFDEMDLVDG